MRPQLSTPRGSARSPACSGPLIPPAIGGRRAVVLALALVVGGIVSSAGCERPRDRLEPGVLAVMETEQTASFVRNFNPLVEAGAVRWPTRRAMYEPMLVFNPLVGEYTPWLAERYSWSDDRLHLRFTIRQGVLWSDGVPFTARDVLFTFELLHRQPALDARALWQHLREVTAPDDQTVDVTFRRPLAPLLEDIAQQAIVPEHVWRTVADPVSFPNETPVATGPFTEVAFFSPQAYEIGRNPRYWGGAPQVKALRFRAYPANEQAILALLNDEIDWGGSFLPAINRVYVKRDPPHHHYWFPLLDATVFLYANTQRPPFDDVRVRKALSMGIDRDRIADIAMHGYTRAADATGLSDAYEHDRDPVAVAAGDWVKHDPVAAGRLLDEAGIKLDHEGRRVLADGRPAAFTLLVPAGFSDWISAAQIAARGLRQIGLEITTRTSEYQAWFEKLQNGEFELSMGWSDLFTTPYGLYRTLMATDTVRPPGQPSAENFHRFGLPAADPLLAALESTVDSTESARLTSALERLFVAHAPAIPLFPGPLWGEFNDARVTGFPDEQRPYAPLSPNLDGPQALLVVTRLVPR